MSLEFRTRVWSGLVTACVVFAVAGCADQGAKNKATPFDLGDAGPGNPDVLFGVWEGQAQVAGTVTATPRIEVRQNRVVYAMRCVGAATGQSATPLIDLTAQVTESTINLIEGGQRVAIVENVQCGVQLSAGNIPKCEAGVPQTKCFTFESGKLTLPQGTTPAVYKKVAD